MEEWVQPRVSALSPDAIRDAEPASLIRAAQAGDRLAFEQLVVLFDRPVLRLVRSVVRSAEDAEDLYQETFLKVYRALPRFRFECSFYTWIYRIATNTCLDYLRRHAARCPAEAVYTGFDGEDALAQELAPDLHPTANPKQLLLSREVEQRIGAALDRLNPRERMVFELKHYQGRRLTTIGAILDTSEATARNALFRATQKLRLALADLTTRGNLEAHQESGRPFHPPTQGVGGGGMPPIEAAAVAISGSGSQCGWSHRGPSRGMMKRGLQ